MRNAFFAVLFAGLFLCVSSAFTQSNVTKGLSLDEAKNILRAAETRAEEDDWTMAIAVVDAGGHLLTFSRKVGTQLASIDLALEKAKAAVFYERPTKSFQKGLKGGSTALLSLPHFSGYEGGVPIKHNGEVIGAIGASGMKPPQDGTVANAGADAFNR